MASGSELAADVLATSRDSIVSCGSVDTASVINVLGESCGAESEDDVDTFPRATGAAGLALSWECSLVHGRNNGTLLGYLRGLSTLDPWRPFQGTPFTALTTCSPPRCSSSLRTPPLRKTPSSVPTTCSFCLLGTTKPQPTMPRDVGFAPPPSLHQRFRFCFQLTRKKNRFTKDTQVSFPLAVEGFLKRCSSTGACGESAHQTRSMSCKPKAEDTCWDSKTTLHARNGVAHGASAPVQSSMSPAPLL